MNSSPIYTSAESSFLGRGTTLSLALPNRRLMYASSLRISWTSTAASLGCAPRLPGGSDAEVIEHLVHGARGLRTAGLADHAGRDPGDGDVIGHRLEHHRARRDARAVADLDVAKNLRTGADHDTLADLGVAVAVVATGTAQRHAMQYGNIVGDRRRLAHHHPGGMVEE